MKSEQEIKEKIEEYKSKLLTLHNSPHTANLYSTIISTLEWVIQMADFDLEDDDNEN